MSGLLTSDYADTSAALGGPAAPPPISDAPLAPVVRKREPQEHAERPSAAPKNSQPVVTASAQPAAPVATPPSAPGQEPKHTYALGAPVRDDPSTWGTARSPDDLVRFWSTEGKLTPVAAQGITMRAQIESGLRPMAPGDFKDGQFTSYGTYQHHADRLEGLKNFAAQNGLNPNDGHTQDMFALHEVQTDPRYKGMIERLNAAQTPEAARDIWTNEFERPSKLTPNIVNAPTAWDEGKATMGNQLLAQMLKDLKEGRENIAKVEKDYKPIEISERPKPPDPDPMKAFSSLAGVFATLAAGFSRTPAIAAMNGMSGAINAAKQHDWEQYAAQTQAWKDNTDLAFKAHDQHSKDVNDAFSHLSTNVGLAHTMLEATTALSRDEQMAKHLANQDYEGAVKLQMERDKNAIAAKQAMPEAYAAEQLQTAQIAYDEARKLGNPQQIEEAKKNYDEYMRRYQEIRAAPYAGRTTSAGSQLMATYRREHPNATPEEEAAFYQRYVAGKEDPYAVGERKDAELDLKTRAQNLKEASAIEKWKNTNAANDGSVKSERRARFNEAKATMPEGTSDSKIWDAVDQQIQESKAPHISEEGLRSAAERFIAGDASALQGFGRNPTLFSKIESKIAEISKDRGLSGADLTRLKQDFAVQTKALKDFATGKQGQTAQSLNVATQHLQLLHEAAKDLAQHGSQAMNRFENAFKNEFNWVEPITFNAIKTIVGSEVEKAVAGAAGALEDRRELREGLAPQATPDQLQSVIEGYRGLMAGQFQGLERTYERTTHRKDFRDEFLLPEARKDLERLSPSSNKNAPTEAPAQLPPEAVKALQQNHETTFGNGQTWTLGPDGQPKRVR